MKPFFIILCYVLKIFKDKVYESYKQPNRLVFELRKMERR